MNDEPNEDFCSPLNHAVEDWLRALDGSTVEENDFPCRFHVEIDELAFDFEDFSDDEGDKVELLGTVLLHESISKDDVEELMEKLRPLVPHPVTLDVQGGIFEDGKGSCIWAVLLIEGERAEPNRLPQVLAEFVDTTTRLYDVAEHFVNARRITIPPADPV